jgi:hypothetical protein
MIPILSGNVASALGGAYEVANSVRLGEDGAFNRSTATPSSRTIMTFSTWFKIGATSGNRHLWGCHTDGNSTMFLSLKNGDQLNFVDYHSSAEQAKLTTTALHRDNSAWYHVCLRLDSTQGTNTNRCRMYINGTQVTSFASSIYPAEDYNFSTNLNTTYVGDGESPGSYQFKGYMAETVLCDGQSYAPTEFGEFDEDSPTIWKPKDVSGLTFGTNGFYLDYEDSSNLGNDANGGTDLTATNLAATDQSTDTPTNNFATFNPLLDVNNPPTFSEGNLKAQGSSSGTARFSGSTICVSNGKWYYEVKVTVGSSSPYVGVIDAQSNMRRQGIYFVNSDADSDNPSGFAVNMSGDIYHNNSNSYATNIGSISTDDILGFKIDMDASPKTCEILKNGSSQRTFNLDEPPSGFYMLGCISIYNQASAIAEINYGSPAYAISSGNADANGYGNFEYAVPSGYYALCTKNLAEFGG